MERKKIERSVIFLENILDRIARVEEWSRAMHYKSSKAFSRHFVRYFRCTPIKVLVHVRVISIMGDLKNTDKTCREIAWHHSMPDEHALNSFLKRHLQIPPTLIRNMSDVELMLLEKNCEVLSLSKKVNLILNNRSLE